MSRWVRPILNFSMRRARLKGFLLREGERFSKTLDQGLKMLDRELSSLSGDVLPGEIAFRLYDTYGFPVDLTTDFLRERDLTVDMEGFERSMQEQRERAKSASRFDAVAASATTVNEEVEFSGYRTLEQDSEIVAILVEDSQAQSVKQDQKAVLVLNATPFYAESGGQVGDTGIIRANGSEFIVEDTQYLSNKVIGHIGHVAAGEFATGKKCLCSSKCRNSHVHDEKSFGNSFASCCLEKNSWTACSAERFVGSARSPEV